MKRIMVILGAYYPNPSANGICVDRLVSALLADGNEVFCLCNSQYNVPDKDDIGNLHIRRTGATAKKKLGELMKNSSQGLLKTVYSLLYKASDIVAIIKPTKYFPVSSISRANKIFKIAEEIVAENNIDIVVGVNLPTDTLYAAYLVKKKHPNIKFVAYCLDPVYGGTNHKFLSKEENQKRNCKFERSMLEACELFIAQHEHCEHYEKNHAEYADKLKFVGVPLLERRENTTFLSDRKEKVLLYAGALSKETRNPAYIFEVFKHTKNIKLKMYVSNGEAWVREAARGIDSVEVNGKIPHEAVLREMDEADAFLNIGNTQTMFCPSKIIEYISYGKPIVSLFRTDSDTCRDYMMKYPVGAYIDERTCDVRKAAEEIERLILGTKEAMPFESLKNLYKDNTPEYVANLICSVPNCKKEEN